MRRLLLPLLGLVGLAACTHHDRHGYQGYGDDGAYGDYRGQAWDDPEDLFRLDPWLTETEEGRTIVERSLGQVYHPEAIRELNIRFRRFADTDRDLRLTDHEIRLALIRCAGHGWRW
jgi:hypothetical protein